MFQLLYNVIYYFFWWVLPETENIKAKSDTDVKAEEKEEIKKKTILKKVNMQKLSKLSVII